MIGLLKNLFGPKMDYKKMIEEGAQVIDVRSPGEFSSGHFPGSKNIPLDRIEKEASKLNKDKTYILCCASGMRSGMATSALKSKGFENVFNAGGWRSI
jgi:rhodanese-related sulfurtransferase